MTTGPLRPDVAIRSQLGHWLRTQTDAIVPDWIAAVRFRPPVRVQGTEAPSLDETILRDLYEAMAIALQVGRYDELEQTAQLLVVKYRPAGYTLASLLGMLSLLKSNLWLAITAAFDADTALLQLQGLDFVFSHLERKVCLGYLDETERTLREEQEQTKFRLEKLDRSKSDFISIAAHELKTPLTLIQGYADILNLELARDTNERRKSALTGLGSGTARLSAIIQDMIAVSMIDNEVLTLHYQPTVLQHVVQMVVNDLEMSIYDRRLAIKVEAFPKDLPSFYADPQRLYLVLNHVIGNSIKYTPDGGKITISARAIKAGAQTAMDFVQVTIADTGIGIDPQDQDRIFDKFYGITEPLRHSSGRTKFKGGGPGLGLAVAKGIIDAHGGKIWVDSKGRDEQGCPGSNFHFMLPVLSQPPAPPRGQQRLAQISK